MAPRRHVEEPPSTGAIKRTFDIPRFDEFRAQLAERDSTPTLFMRRSVLDFLEGRHITIAYLRPENKAFLTELAEELGTKDMQFVFEKALEELRLTHRKPKK